MTFPDDDWLRKLQSGTKTRDEISTHAEQWSKRSDCRNFLLTRWSDKTWGDRHGPNEHRYVTWLMACMLLHDRSLSRHPSVLAGVSGRLENLSREVVRLGILIGQFVSESALGCYAATEQDAFCRQVYELWRWQPAAMPCTDGEGSGETNDRTETENDDVDEHKDASNEVILLKPLPPPVFLDELSDYLVSDDDWRKHQAVLDSFESVMIKAGKLEWQDHGERLFRNCIFWEDRFNCLPEDRHPQVRMLAVCLLRDNSLARLVGSFVLGNDVNLAKRCFLVQASLEAVGMAPSDLKRIAPDTQRSRLAEGLLRNLLTKATQSLPLMVFERVSIASAAILHNIRQAVNVESLLALYIEHVARPGLVLAEGNFAVWRALLLALNLTLPIAIKEAGMWIPVLEALSTVALPDTSDKECAALYGQVLRLLADKFGLPSSLGPANAVQ